MFEKANKTVQMRGTNMVHLLEGKDLYRTLCKKELSSSGTPFRRDRDKVFAGNICKKCLYVDEGAK